MQKEETTGDHQEFDEMYRRTQAEIYKFIRYRVADKELAKDVLQETYYVAYKKWDILCEHSNPMGWLINTAKNKIRELNKSLKKIECEVGLDADEYTFTEDGYGKSELDLIITKGLTEEEKNRFYKYFLHGYSISELAQLEKTSENNMSVRISRLRSKIAQNIPDESGIDKKYKKSVRQVCDIQELSEYSFIYSKIIRSTHKDNIYVFMRGNKDIIRFEIIVYPQEILRVREIYPGYIFEREFEDDGIIFDVLSKKELSRQNTYLMYFYFGKEKYIVMSNEDESSLQSIVVEYKNLILESNINK